jgi:hypothetical protein
VPPSLPFNKLSIEIDNFVKPAFLYQMERTVVSPLPSRSVEATRSDFDGWSVGHSHQFDEFDRIARPEKMTRPR